MKIEGLPIIGTGGMSVVYRISDDLAVKVFRQGITYVDVLHEYDMAHRAYELGMPTPKPYRIESIENTQRDSGQEQYGIVYELLHGDTLSKAMTEHPERLEYYAEQMALLYKQLHSTVITPQSNIPDAHHNEEEAIRRLIPLFGQEAAEKLTTILKAIPKGDRLLHCDLHPRNVMLHNGKMMVIDMGEVGYGNPIMDIAHAHALMTSGLVDVERFMGFPEALAEPFWTTTLNRYFEGLTEQETKQKRDYLDIICLIRCFTWLAVSEGLPPEVIDRFKGHFKRCVTDRWDEIEGKLGAYLAPM